MALEGFRRVIVLENANQITPTFYLGKMRGKANFAESFQSRGTEPWNINFSLNNSFRTQKDYSGIKNQFACCEP